MKVAVFGAGSIGQRHIGTLLKLEADIIAIDPASPSVPDRVALARWADDIDGPLDAALICTPATEHYSCAKKALELGAHVFIEKPIAHDLRTAQQFIPLAAAYPGRTFMVGYNLRFDPEFQRFAASLADLGRPIYATVRYSGYLPSWRPGRDYRQTPSARRDLGGGILNEASHELDLINCLFGGRDGIAAISGKRSDLEIDVEDCVSAMIEMRSGMVVELHLDFVTPGERHSIQYFGAGGAAEWNLLPGSPMYEREITYFLDCVNERRRPVVGIEEGIDAMEFIEDIRFASATRRSNAA